MEAVLIDRLAKPYIDTMIKMLNYIYFMEKYLIPNLCIYIYIYIHNVYK